MSSFFSISGQLDYNEVLLIQRRLNELVNSGKLSGAILILEHNEVYTCGIHKDMANISPEHDIIMVERGGGITYHCPGQIVIYFFVDMKELHLNARLLIELIHASIIQMLNEMGIEARSMLGNETGIWVMDRKICSTGLAIKGNSTLHGTALNYSNALDGFRLINPCGFDPAVMTSCRKESRNEILPIEAAKAILGEKLCRALNIDFQNKKSWEETKNFVNGQLSEIAP